jgi:hypothetical protein
MSSTMGTPIAAMLMWLVVDVTVVDVAGCWCGCCW